MKPSKYALPEIERRWLVRDEFLAGLAAGPYRIVEDLYVEATLLRVRSIREADGETIYKLCKKYGRRDSLANPITNIYLTEAEHLALDALPGARVRKHRYALPEGAAIDVYPPPLALAIFEMEFDSEQAAADYIAPELAGMEVTGDIAYSGAALALRSAQARR